MGPSHPSTLTAVNNLALLLKGLGKFGSQFVLFQTNADLHFTDLLTFVGAIRALRRNILVSFWGYETR